MPLVQSHHVRDAEASTPASVFAEKYDWLLRWALHFTQQDHAVAEDLVQESFVRLIISWPKIKDHIDQAEPFLYSTLKYAHLMELRRGRRFNFQDLALIEFDDLRMSLREEKTTDPIEVQDDLRRIVAYLCWRKRAVKSASVLLLRFFHGYFPEEIARIALMKRGSIDELLRVAREEVKAYLADSSSLEIMHQGKMPELMPRQVAVPQERFAEELQATIEQARTMECPSREQWLQRYQAGDPKPLPTDLLAHVASCEHCLTIINARFDFPSRSDCDGIVASGRRGKRGSGGEGKASAAQIQRSIAGGMARFHKLYQHHPRALMIAVNGDVIAMRDVNSATSELKVQTGRRKSLGIIDVLSEQQLTLLTLYVPAGPPQAPPEVRHEIGLSDNRKLELLLRFTSDGAVIELHYNDPHFLASSLDETDLIETDFEDAMDDGLMQQPAEVEVPRQHRPWWKRIFGCFALVPMPEMTPMLATAIVCAVAAITLFALSLHRSSVMKPGELLARASTEATSSRKSGAKGVIVQTVRIQAAKRRLERTVYRDVEGLRYPRWKMPDSEEARLQDTLAAAGVNWADPLSPESFGYWHGQAAIQMDRVKRNGTGLLTLTTTVNDPVVTSESLTVRESDFHAVGRSIALRNQGTIEIAEVSYGVFPWASINPDLFEPLSPLSPAWNEPAWLPHNAAPLTELQLDEAELSARLVLQRLQLDGSNQLALRREPDGIYVQGVVLSLEEKHRLQAELHLVPHAVASISTLEEMNAQPSAGSKITSIKLTSVDVAEPSSLERYLAEKGNAHETAGPLAQELVDSSFDANHESKAITELLQRFAQNDRLSPAARSSLSQLLAQHKVALLNALQKEEQQLSALNLTSNAAAVANEPAQNNAEGLRSAAERNFSLCMELTSGSNASARPTQVIVSQLNASIAQLRAVTVRLSAASQPHPPSTNNTASNHESR